MNLKEEVNTLIEDLYRYRNTSSGKEVFNEFKKNGYLSKLKSLAEDYTEVEDNWGSPKTFKNVGKQLSALTNNFTVESTDLETDDLQLRVIAEKIFKQYYRVVEVKEVKDTQNQWVISVSGLKEEKEVVAESFDTPEKLTLGSVVNLAVNNMKLHNVNMEDALRDAIQEADLKIDDDEFIDLLARVESELRIDHEII